MIPLLKGATMTALRIENLTKQYKDVIAVDDLSLEIAEGELLSLLGLYLGSILELCQEVGIQPFHGLRYPDWKPAESTHL